MVEAKAARQLKKLLNDLVDHSHGHHEAIRGLWKRMQDLDRRIKAVERKRRKR